MKALTAKEDATEFELLVHALPLRSRMAIQGKIAKHWCSEVAELFPSSKLHRGLLDELPGHSNHGIASVRDPSLTKSPGDNDSPVPRPLMR
ncbi:hypothetical protein CEXT_806361 [Caerostris extrusa]|uniref:Uncharacterized protein n=1 Tax=Caerostris extrusa TaxID=172846 RepID=A0AAV4UC99_CAEEX|nr:hypothetical protein CEXT_806361 [Caerostris extrusa]